MIKFFEAFISGTPEIVWRNITKIRVNYIDFNGDAKSGVIECNKKVAKELESIFKELFRIKFPIKEINPISYYDNDDMRSVKANNTSCFNYRFVIGSNKLSDHSTGNAIDINPMQNPWVHPSAHKIEGREYNPLKKGTITDDVVEIFKLYGWSWGGNWKNPDYQHFFKPDNDLKNEILRTVVLKEALLYHDDLGITRIKYKNQGAFSDIDPYNEENWNELNLKFKDKVRTKRDHNFNHKDYKPGGIVIKTTDILTYIGKPSKMWEDWGDYFFKCDRYPGCEFYFNADEIEPITNESLNDDIDPYNEEDWGPEEDVTIEQVWDVINKFDFLRNKKIDRGVISFDVDYPNRGYIQFGIEKDYEYDGLVKLYPIGLHDCKYDDVVLNNGTEREFWDKLTFLVEGV